MSTIREKFSLEPQPEIVARLEHLCKSTEEASLDEIADIISKDDVLTSRTLKIAFPGQDDRTADDLFGAVNRLGTGIILILTMGDMLGQAVLKTFDTMLGINLTKVDPLSVTRKSEPCHMGSVDFSGSADGRVHLVFANALGERIASHLFDVPNEELTEEMVTDSVGELVNIITGNLQSNISGAGILCKLKVPDVRCQDEPEIDPIKYAKNESFVFTSDEVQFWVHFSIKL